MSPTGDRHRSPRKLLSEAADGREQDRPHGSARTIEFVAGDGKLLELHPCETARRKWQVTATCCCGEVRWVRLDPLLTTYLAHAPWPRVMQAMKCTTCGDQPCQLAFSYTSSSCQQVTFGTIRVRLAQTGAADHHGRANWT